MESIFEGHQPTSIADLKIAAEAYLQRLNDKPKEDCENLSQSLLKLLSSHKSDTV